jgi:hypothetical protein
MLHQLHQSFAPIMSRDVCFESKMNQLERKLRPKVLSQCAAGKVVLAQLKNSFNVDLILLKLMYGPVHHRVFEGLHQELVGQGVGHG